MAQNLLGGDTRMSTCGCGQPATHQINTGHHKRGTRWVRTLTWMCPGCGTEAELEREAQRRT